MARWIPVLAFCSLGLLSSFAPPQDGDTTLGLTARNRHAASLPVASLRTVVPNRPRFVLHGTIPIAPRPFVRFPCPFVVHDPDGTPLPTQWELVARTDEKMIVEILAVVENRWSGEQTFTVNPGAPPSDGQHYDEEALSAITTQGAIQLVVEDQSGKLHRFSLSGGPTLSGSVNWSTARVAGPATPFTMERMGPATMTFRRHVRIAPFGAVHVWMTVRAHTPEIEVILNWHNGALPAKPDAYFRSAALVVPPGVRWTPLLPDPAMSYPLLVTPDDHILPQRMERSFRVVMHAANETPDLSLRGWAVTPCWSKGGYMPQQVALPNLDHLAVDLTSQKNDDFYRLANNLPTSVEPGEAPVSVLYPAEGVRYGGMAGGIHIEQIPFVPLAVTGQSDGLLSAYVEQLRYASRQMGCIYEPDGRPIAMDDYLNPNGTKPWVIYNNTFLIQGGVPKDDPFNFSETGPGVGTSSYDPRTFFPIDVQHYVRRTKANKALVWLDNDPLARLYMLMDAELIRMTIYEGPGGLLVLPTAPGEGIRMGRAEAWSAEAMVAGYAIGDDAWRQRTYAWFLKFVDALRMAQMPNQLFSATDTGRHATTPPYGNGTQAFYWVHRSNEQMFLINALRGIDRTTGIDCRDLIRTGGEGIWNFAWKVGTDGTLNTYPAGPIGGPRYATRAEIMPVGLTAPEGWDSYHVASATAYAQVEGANMGPAVLAITGAQDLPGALSVFESWGLENIANRAYALHLLQQFVGP